MVTLGKLPQTPRAKKVIEYAMEEARGLNHDYIGTEHILLGLLRETEGVACIILVGFGLLGARRAVLDELSIRGLTGLVVRRGARGERRAADRQDQRRYGE